MLKKNTNMTNGNCSGAKVITTGEIVDGREDGIDLGSSQRRGIKQLLAKCGARGRALLGIDTVTHGAD